MRMNMLGSFEFDGGLKHSISRSSPFVSFSVFKKISLSCPSVDNFIALFYHGEFSFYINL